MSFDSLWESAAPCSSNSGKPEAALKIVQGKYRGKFTPKKEKEKPSRKGVGNKFRERFASKKKEAPKTNVKEKISLFNK
jgi:hypothetical protein